MIQTFKVSNQKKKCSFIQLTIQIMQYAGEKLDKCLKKKST